MTDSVSYSVHYLLENFKSGQRPDSRYCYPLKFFLLKSPVIPAIERYLALVTEHHISSLSNFECSSHTKCSTIYIVFLDVQRDLMGLGAIDKQFPSFYFDELSWESGDAFYDLHIFVKEFIVLGEEYKLISPGRTKFHGKLIYEYQSALYGERLELSVGHIESEVSHVTVTTSVIRSQDVINPRIAPAIVALFIAMSCDVLFPDVFTMTSLKFLPCSYSLFSVSCKVLAFRANVR